jgi:ketosteroid isomerase-like protein
MRLLVVFVALAGAVSTCSPAQILAPATQAQAAPPTMAQPPIVSPNVSPNVSPAVSPSDPGAGIGFGLGLGSQQPALNPLTQPTLTPGMIHLMELETKFAAAVAVGGGKAFASWFADDAVTLANGHAPVIGREAIAAQAQWDAKDYQLTWTAQGAQMGPSNDMGFTWGHYEGTGKDAHGQPVTHSGRYITVWKQMPDGSWKVSLDASAEEPAEPGACCALPKP